MNIKGLGLTPISKKAIYAIKVPATLVTMGILSNSSVGLGVEFFKIHLINYYNLARSYNNYTTVNIYSSSFLGYITTLKQNKKIKRR